VLALVFVPLSVAGLLRWRHRPGLVPVVTLLVVTIGVAWVMTTLTLSIHRYLAPAAGLLLIPVVDLVAARFSRSRRRCPRPAR
jgi:hypothetical protein